MIVTFIPAAGRSSRMQGKDKLLERVKGVPILRRTALTALAADLGPVVIGLPPKARERRKVLRNLDVEIIEVSDADEGMAATLRAGAAMALNAIATYQAGDYEYCGMLVMLPDMPEIEAGDLREMDLAFQSSGGPVIRATTEDAKPGHPVLFPDNVVREFDELRGDKGAASLLDGEEWVCQIALPGQRARLDLNSPEDWANWRAENADD